MERLDLNIENYELNDILNLFKIPHNFNENHLKYAKKIVLKTHPDKSGLSPDYFRFFSKAYKVIYEIWEFKNKSSKNLNNYSTEYNSSNDFFNREKKNSLDNYFEKERKNKEHDFNRWFNEQFEKNKIDSEEQQHGYGNWLKSNEDIDEERKISLTQMNEEIEIKKQRLRSLIVYKGIDELHSNFTGYSTLTGDIPDNFSSDLFSNLQYEDLRKAHTETVIPVTLDDYNNVKKFNNVNEYTSYRNSIDTTPLSEQHAREYLSNKNKLEENEATERAYKLAKQLEESQKKQEKYWANMRLLNDK